jgi:uncharacterized protein
MKLEHNFTVAAPVEQAWQVLLDLERIAPCMPGASLTSYEGDEFAGNVRVKLGPVLMTFAGSGRFTERDEPARRLVVEASGKEKRGGGTARATVAASLHGDGESTVVAGLHFVGVHFLRKRKSSLLIGVGEDAALVADSIASA